MSRRSIVRYCCLLLYLSLVYLSWSVYYIQSNFQAFLHERYITFDDFPSEYTHLLQTHNESLVRSFNYSLHYPLDASRQPETVPNIIHFIWFHNLYETHVEVSEIPSKRSRAPEVCLEYNPNYEIHIWNAEDARTLLATEYAWFLPTYDAYPHPIQRVDAFKYFLLWHYGGIYMDLDIECRRSLDPLLRFPAWFPEASPLGVNNDLMAARPHHPVVHTMLRTLSARNRNLLFPYLTIFWSTGPQFVGDVLKQWYLDHPRIITSGAFDDESWHVLPQMFYSEEFTFFGHTPGGTWHGADVAVVIWCVKHPLVLWSSVGTMLGLIWSLYRFRRTRVLAMMTSSSSTMMHHHKEVENEV